MNGKNISSKWMLTKIESKTLIKATKANAMVNASCKILCISLLCVSVVNEVPIISTQLY